VGKFTFSRELRLLTPNHFKFVFEQATPAVSPQITVLARANQGNIPKLGITIAKKKVKHAHERNRLKRVIRESFRHNQATLPPVDIIVIGKTGLDGLTNKEIFTILNKLWKKICHRCNT
jgi:ribonuclease P protein component